MSPQGRFFPPAVIANQSADWCGNPFSKIRFACFYKLWVKRNAPPRMPLRVKIRGTKEYAGMVELVDSGDLGSPARACRFESCCPHHLIRQSIFYGLPYFACFAPITVLYRIFVYNRPFRTVAGWAFSAFRFHGQNLLWSSLRHPKMC